MAGRKTSKTKTTRKAPVPRARAASVEPDAAADARDRAQELVYQAWEASTATQRIALARTALRLWADCADAYVVLADHAPEAEQLDLLRQAVAAGERELGPEPFREDVGHFYGIFETRPYMRARAELARHLIQAGQPEEAFSHYRDLLRLNASDNQGLRYLFAQYLLGFGRHDELSSLLARFDDGTAMWAYTAALLAFRCEGDSTASRAALAVALRANRHVPSYMAGDAVMPLTLPDYVGFGDETEAAAYVLEALATWIGTPGAVAWVRRCAGTGRRAGRRRRPARPATSG